MSSHKSLSSKWPRLKASTYGLPNIWHQSKTWGPMRREQKLEFLQRQLKRENQEQIGSCMTKISEECKNLLKEKMKEVMDFNSSLNNPTDSNKYQYYRCFKCKELGHIIKFCPNNKKKYKKTRMEGIEAPKPTVMVTYPETIHFSTTSMIKDTDLTTWDEIWYVSDKLDRHVCYKLDFFCNIKENFTVTNLENQRKFLFSYGMGEILIEQGRNKLIIPGVCYTPEVTLNILSQELLEKQGFTICYEGNRCSIVPMFKDKKVVHFDEDRMRMMHNKYIQDYFESITKKRKAWNRTKSRSKEVSIQPRLQPPKGKRSDWNTLVSKLERDTTDPTELPSTLTWKEATEETLFSPLFIRNQGRKKELWPQTQAVEDFTQYHMRMYEKTLQRQQEVVEGKFTRLGRKSPKISPDNMSFRLAICFERPVSLEEMLKELQSDLKYGLSALIAVEADQVCHVIVDDNTILNTYEILIIQLHEIVPFSTRL
ncbi:ARID DNA-binding domain-containing protein [Tanacetum coccineum]